MNFISVFAGLSLYNISMCYIQTGDLQRAIEFMLESLRVWQTALPPGHQHILLAEDMLRKFRNFLLESLRSLQTALPPGHQDIRNAEDMLRYLEHAMQEGRGRSRGTGGCALS